MFCGNETTNFLHQKKHLSTGSSFTRKKTPDHFLDINVFFSIWSFPIAASSYLLVVADSSVIEQFILLVEPIIYFEVFTDLNWLLGKHLNQSTACANYDSSNSFEI